MESFFYFFKPISWMLLFASCFYIIGKTIIIKIFKLPNSDASFFLSSVMGLCFTIFGEFVLLSLNIFNSNSVLALIIIPIIFCLAIQPNLITLNWNLNAVRKHYALIAIVIAFWLSVAIRVFLPESGHDALSYHLPYAKSLATSGSLTVELYLRYPLNTLNFDLLFSLGYLFDGEILARMFTLYATFLMLIGIYTFALLFFNAYVATIATWMFISSQLILNIMNMAYIDIGFSLFIFAAIFAFFLYQNENHKNRLYMVAIFLGIALGTKYLGLLVVPSVLFWMFIISKDKKHYWLATLIVFVLASPWYLRNIIISSNPVHPFLQPLFGFWLWTPIDLIYQNNDLYSVHGVERTWFNLIKLPWLILQDSFVRIGPTNILYVLSSPLILLGLFKAGILRQICLFLLFHIVIWFFSSQIMRYFIFALPLLSLLIAYYIYQLFHFISKLIFKFNRSKQQNSAKKQHLFGISFIMICLSSTANYHYQVISDGTIPSTQAQWQKRLNQNPEYELAEAANSQQGATLKLGFSSAAHYFERQVMGDYYGLANMIEFSKSVKSATDAKDQMQKLQAELLLIDKQQELFLKVHEVIQNSADFELIYQNQRGILYKLNNKQL